MRRPSIVLAAALVFIAVSAAPAPADGAGSSSVVRLTPPAGGWTLTLQGRTTKVLPIAAFPATASWDGSKAGNINPSLRYVYTGQLLYKLVGKVDDARPGFNVAKAKKGYSIQFVCLDGYKPVLNSKVLFRRGKLRTDLVLAKLKAGALLPAAEGPFRFVGGPPITQPFNNKLSAFGVTKIRLIF
jgi:hypothetical protein